MQPITIHMSPAGPNPWKPVLLLEELGLPYDINSFNHALVKEKPFTDLNPNGRAPAIEDPNTGLVLWESGAILQYIIEQYDTQHVLSYGPEKLKERHLCNQWLAFQISGQGPYFGQATWFQYLHAEQLPSAITRYVEEVKRVLGVLDNHLEGKQWLVDEKMTYADLAFTTWNDRVDAILACAPEGKFDGFPNVHAWHERMVSRPAWKKVMAKRVECMAEQGLQPNGMPIGINSMEEFQEMMKKQAEKAE